MFRRYPELKNRKWKHVGDRAQNSVLNNDLYAYGFTSKYIEKITGIRHTGHFIYFDADLYIDEDEHEAFKAKFLKNCEEYGYLKKVVDNCGEAHKKLYDFCSGLLQKSFEEGEVRDHINLLFDKLFQVMPLSYILQNYESIPITILRKIIEKRDLEIDKYCNMLIAPSQKNTFSSDERYQLNKLAIEIKEKGYSIDNLPKEFEEKLDQHLKEFGWLSCKYFSLIYLTISDLKEKLKSTVYNNYERNNKSKEDDFNKAVDELRLNEKERDTVNLIRELFYLKTYRKELISFVTHASANLFKKLAELENLSYEECINQTIKEVDDFLSVTKSPDKDVINERLKGFIHVAIDGRTEVMSYQKKDIAFVKDKNTLFGLSSNRGIVHGFVRVIQKMDDIKELKEKEIIVIDTLSTDLTPYLFLANGIVTNHGGLLSHAAYVSRELNIPSVINTGYATNILRTGDFVELNGNNGTVTKIETLDFEEAFQITAGLERAELYMPTHVFRTREILGKGHSEILFIVKNGKNVGYFSKKDIEHIGNHGLFRLQDKEFIRKNIIEAEKQCQETIDFGKFVDSLDLMHIPDEELIEHFNQLYELIQKTYGYFNVSQPAISLAIEKAIDKQKKIELIPLEVSEQIPAKVLVPDKYSTLELEELELIKIVKVVKSNPKLTEIFSKDSEKNIIKEIIRHDSIFSMLQSHQKKFGYFAGYENFDMHNIDFYVKRIKRYIQNNELFNKVLQKRDFDKIKTNREEFYIHNKISNKLRHLIDIARTYSYQRMEVRLAHTFGISMLGKFYGVFARRMCLPFEEVTYLLKQEILDFFEKGIQPSKIAIEERKKAVVYWIKNDTTHILSGEEANKFIENFLTKKYDQDVIKGKGVSKGIVKGRVKRVDYGKNIASQIDSMGEGAILVSGNTRPEMMLAVQKASAIVTDEGGILSHAALVSRELGIPCIIGTKYATKILKDGDMVEVNADEGIVRKLE